MHFNTKCQEKLTKSKAWVTYLGLICYICIAFCEICRTFSETGIIVYLA